MGIKRQRDDLRFRVRDKKTGAIYAALTVKGLSAELGLTEDQIRRALDYLTDKNWIVKKIVPHTKSANRRSYVNLNRAALRQVDCDLLDGWGLPPVKIVSKHRYHPWPGSQNQLPVMEMYVQQLLLFFADGQTWQKPPVHVAEDHEIDILRRATHYMASIQARRYDARNARTLAVLPRCCSMVPFSPRCMALGTSQLALELGPLSLAQAR